MDQAEELIRQLEAKSSDSIQHSSEFMTRLNTAGTPDTPLSSHLQHLMGQFEERLMSAVDQKISNRLSQGPFV